MLRFAQRTLRSQWFAFRCGSSFCRRGTSRVAAFRRRTSEMISGRLQGRQ
jgi:hypothetical protein